MVLPNTFLKEFRNFEDWHLQIESELQADHGLEVLHHSFELWKNQYTTMVSVLENICFKFELDVQNKIREHVKKSKVFQYHLEAPYYKQIIEKPRGYAGDSEMMNIIYRKEFEDTSLMGKLIHKIATECDACIAVRNRWELLARLITNRRLFCKAF